jgi:hypothetical protein
MLVRAAKLYIEKDPDKMRFSDDAFLSNLSNYDDFSFLWLPPKSRPKIGKNKMDH